MTRIINLLFLLGTFYTLSCSEDKGNYDYKPINSITIDSIKSDNPIVVGKNLVITPKIIRAKDASEEGLTYSWTVNEKEIATTRDLNYTVPNELGFGSKDCRYVIKDTKNGMEYFKQFRIEVMNPFNWGYYFLTEKPDNSTELAFISVLGETKEFVYANGVGEATFGNKPISINGSAGSVTLEGKTTYCFFFNVLTKEGQYPVIGSETATFYPNKLISDDKFIDQDAGYKFNPTANITMMMGGDDFYCSDGQMVAHVSQLLYQPAISKDHYWSHPLAHTSGARLAFVFDEITKKYYVIKPEITNVDLGIYTNKYLFERVVPITNFPSLEGHAIVKADAGPMYSNPCSPIVITYKDGLANFIKFTYSSSGVGTVDFEKGSLVHHKTLSIPGFDANSIVIGSKNDWFIATKSAIYIAAKEDLNTLREFIKLPVGLGDVTSLQLSVSGTKLIVSIYDPNSSEEKKGSVLFVNSSTGEIVDSYKNVIHKCVSTLSANFFYKYGKDE